MKNDIITIQNILSRISSDYYRLSDFSRDYDGSDKFSPELTEAIIELGHSLDVVSDLIEIEEDHHLFNKYYENSVREV
jgi:hypothetical protein